MGVAKFDQLEVESKNNFKGGGRLGFVDDS